MGRQGIQRRDAPLSARQKDKSTPQGSTLEHKKHSWEQFWGLPCERLHVRMAQVLGAGFREEFLAAQCEIPPHIAQYPFEIVSQRGGIAPICLVFIGYRASIAEIPLLRGGVSHLHFACSPSGKRSEKGEGVSHPIGHVETPKTP